MTRGEWTSPFCGDGCMGCKLTISGLAGIGSSRATVTIHCRGRMSAGLTWSDLRFKLFGKNSYVDAARMSGSDHLSVGKI